VWTKNFALPLATLFAVSACGGSGNVQLDTVEQRGSYAIGVNIGRDMLRAGPDFDFNAIKAGLSDALAEADLKLTDEELAQSFQEFSDLAREQAQGASAEAAGANEAEGAAFLEENGARDGVMTTASGLQYEVVTEGSGPRPTPSDRVAVNYVGTLIDGTQFDAGTNPDQPVVFGVTQVIAGWTEGLQLMTVGSVYRLFVSGNLAYGQGGSGPQIGPNATLIFEVTLIGIQ
jgi:FKBP-type peptidyl-prolyl cis-trans isomerase